MSCLGSPAKGPGHGAHFLASCTACTAKWRDSREAFMRMLVPVAALSAGASNLPLVRETLFNTDAALSTRFQCPQAFLSNTAIVTMMIPIIVSWSRTLGAKPGKLLMPLSFADPWRNGSHLCFRNLSEKVPSADNVRSNIRSKFSRSRSRTLRHPSRRPLSR